MKTRLSYKGFILAKGTDYLGCISWSVYKNGSQFSSSLLNKFEAIEWVNNHLSGIYN